MNESSGILRAFSDTRFGRNCGTADLTVAQSSYIAAHALEGIVQPYPVPEWDIDEWFNGDPGNVTSNRNR